MSSPEKSGGWVVGEGSVWDMVHRTAKNSAVKVDTRYIMIDDFGSDREEDVSKTKEVAGR